MRKVFAILLMFVFIITAVFSVEKGSNKKPVDKEKSEKKFTQMEYIKQVLNYTLDKAGKNVRLDNDDFNLLIKTGMIFELKNKKYNSVIKGRWGYQLEVSDPKEGTMFFLILENPESMSREDFLKNSNYTEKAEILLAPIDATDDTVVFLVKKSNINFGREKVSFKKTIE